MGFDTNKINLVKFQDRKWNFPNRKLNYLSHFQASDQRKKEEKCLKFPDFKLPGNALEVSSTVKYICDILLQIT